MVAACMGAVCCTLSASTVQHQKQQVFLIMHQNVRLALASRRVGSELLQVLCFLCVTILPNPLYLSWHDLLYNAQFLNFIEIRDFFCISSRCARVKPFFAKQCIMSGDWVWDLPVCVCMQFSRIWSAFMWIIITLWRFFPSLPNDHICSRGK